jgi:trehalose synthase
MDLTQTELDEVRGKFGLDPDRPLLVQISRFDRFKDPVGVVQAYRMVRRVLPVQLVLAGGGATDDPEGKEILDEVKEVAGDDPDIHVLLLPANAHRTINAFQRLADIIIQKSTREGFGLTVTEALWKGKPVIGGDVGGIKIQVTDHFTGHLVNTVEGAAHRIRFLLHHRDKMMQMGVAAREFVRENFLLTRHLRDHLTLMAWLLWGDGRHTIAV